MCSIRSILVDVFHSIPSSRCLLFRSGIAELNVRFQCVWLAPKSRAFCRKSVKCTHAINAYSGIFILFKESPNSMNTSLEIAPGEQSSRGSHIQHPVSSALFRMKYTSRIPCGNIFSSRLYTSPLHRLCRMFSIETFSSRSLLLTSLCARRAPFVSKQLRARGDRAESAKHPRTALPACASLN